jgi:hypothetical protein
MGKLKHAPLCLLLLAGCAAPLPQSKPDPASQPGYAEAAGQLAALNREAEDLLKRGLTEDAATAITRGQRIETRLLAAPRPTLAAMEAVSDLDDLYARMLLLNHHDGWARMLYQKNRTRWKKWEPPTADSLRRLHQAEAGMAECDRRINR